MTDKEIINLAIARAIAKSGKITLEGVAEELRRIRAAIARGA